MECNPVFDCTTELLWRLQAAYPDRQIPIATAMIYYYDDHKSHCLFDIMSCALPAVMRIHEFTPGTIDDRKLWPGQ